MSFFKPLECYCWQGYSIIIHWQVSMGVWWFCWLFLNSFFRFPQSSFLFPNLHINPGCQVEVEILSLHEAPFDASVWDNWLWCVVSGEIVLMLDNEEVELKAGDVFVQRGTNHAWSNRSNLPCRVAFVLVTAKFEDELKNIKFLFWKSIKLLLTHEILMFKQH